MQLTVRSLTQSFDVDIAMRDGDVTIGELVRMTLGVAPPVVSVDGRPVPASTLAVDANLARGSIVDATVHTEEQGLVLLREVGGIDAGWSQWLGAGSFELGAVARRKGVPFDPAMGLAIVTVSRDALVVVAPEMEGIELDQRPLAGSTEWNDETLFVAGRLFRIEQRLHSVRPPTPQVTNSGMTPVTRPTRTALAAKQAPVTVPEFLPTVTAPRKLPLVSLLAPLPLAAMMAFILGPRALLFGLLTPVMTIATWLEDKRQRRANLKHDKEQIVIAETALRGALKGWVDEEANRLHQENPDLAEIIERARFRMPSLWQRRLGDDDALRVVVGRCDQLGRPQVVDSKRVLDVDGIVRSTSPMVLAPLVISLSVERGIGLSGDSAACSAAAYATLTQLAFHHGPADVRIAVFTSSDRAADWEALKWLPHALDENGALQLCVDVEGGRRLVANIQAAPNRVSQDAFGGKPLFGVGKNDRRDPVWIIFVDDPRHHRGRDAPLRALVAERNEDRKFVVLAQRSDELPAVCTAVVTMRRMRSRTDGGDSARAPVIATVAVPGERWFVDDVVVDGLTARTFGDFTRSLASAEDPEHVIGSGASLPTSVALPPLLRFAFDEGSDDAAHLRAADRVSEELVKAWLNPGVIAPRSPIGVSASGVVELDVVDDGPHGLLAGTTGAGKSEFLRTFVSSLACRVPPDQLHFLLIDYKGGSAFDACTELPHVVGLVTDLDEHLGERVLRSLQAEIRYRERLLRSLGVTDLDSVLQRAAQSAERSPLARLLIVVDEFATLAAELPAFLPSLVDVAQRGRSLGMHLILATQRPAGVLDNKIKANINLRIALRVQDEGDSIDVLGAKVAALIQRGKPGRGYIRKGAGELLEFQAAQVTSAFGNGSVAERVEIRPYQGIGRDDLLANVLSKEGGHDGLNSRSQVTDLAVLVAGVGAAATRLGFGVQRRPYLDALPAELPFSWLGEASGEPNAELESLATPGVVRVAIGMLDEPDDQKQTQFAYEIAPGSNAIAFGVAGSGTTTFLRTVVLSLARTKSPKDLHIYVIDADSGGLFGLADLPHVGGVAGLNDLSVVTRVLRTVHAEFDRRRNEASHRGPETVRAQDPLILLAIDNVVSLRQTLQDDPRSESALTLLDTLARDGSALGIYVVVSASSERGVGAGLLTSLGSRFLFRLVDSSAYMSFGIRPRDVPLLGPGRCLIVGSEVPTELQIARSSDDDVAEIVRTWSGIARSAPEVALVPHRVEPHHLDPARTLRIATRPGTFVPVGIDLETALVRGLTIVPGERLLVLGPARSGKSSMAHRIVTSISDGPNPPRIAVVCPRPSPLRDLDPTRAWVTTDMDSLDAWEGILLGNSGHRVVVVDDADRISHPVLDRLATTAHDDITVIVIARTEAMRGFGFWAKPLSASRTGLVFRPTSADGELLRVALGSKLPPLQHVDALVVDDGSVGYARTVGAP